MLITVTIKTTILVNNMYQTKNKYYTTSTIFIFVIANAYYMPKYT